MENKELDSKLMREMFNTIRSAEIKNVKTQKVDDKKMVDNIMKYVFSKVQKESTNED